MFIVCWAAKGGSGATVVASALALLAAERPGGAVLVDLAGDAATVTGCDAVDPGQPGLTDYAERLGAVAPDSLAHLLVGVAPGLRLLPPGTGRLPEHDRAWVGVVAGLAATVVVDAGTRPRGSAAAALAHADASLLVTRACYPALRRAMAEPDRPTGVILVEETGRALGRRDVEAAIGRPVVARVRLDERTARSVDSGLLAQRLPRSLTSGLDRVV